MGWSSAGVVSVSKHAIANLEEAFMLCPSKLDTKWCLGNASTSHAFMMPQQALSEVFGAWERCYMVSFRGLAVDIALLLGVAVSTEVTILIYCFHWKLIYKSGCIRMCTSLLLFNRALDYGCFGLSTTAITCGPS
ncbi:hypothetical protein JRO89_XS09G0033100 [Xanthoceras sorbifolium]|uniref:Uncharacterized protein n=1 Tax=Xanthoceras sorbifolium TaxID=99658 RepID=A0ABQ8HKF8_9ROSI|nr:hypothetical protein JRO89_XS09G0033100 [Xanthoceras sorbifolium]